MDKPISVTIEESKKILADTINSLQLHPYILEPILKGLYEEVEEIKRETYQSELQNYNNSLEKEESEDK